MLGVITINKTNKYVTCFLCALILISTFIKTYGLYHKYTTDKENKNYIVVVIQKLGEDESNVKYLVKLELDSFILHIYKENKFDKNIVKQNHSNYIYGDELKVRGKIYKSELYGNPRRI